MLYEGYELLDKSHAMKVLLQILCFHIKVKVSL